MSANKVLKTAAVTSGLKSECGDRQHFRLPLEVGRMISDRLGKRETSREMIRMIAGREQPMV